MDDLEVRQAICTYSTISLSSVTWHGGQNPAARPCQAVEQNTRDRYASIHLALLCMLSDKAGRRNQINFARLISRLNPPNLGHSSTFRSYRFHTPLYISVRPLPILKERLISKASPPSCSDDHHLIFLCQFILLVKLFVICRHSRARKRSKGQKGHKGLAGVCTRLIDDFYGLDVLSTLHPLSESLISCPLSHQLACVYPANPRARCAKQSCVWRVTILPGYPSSPSSII